MRKKLFFCLLLFFPCLLFAQQNAADYYTFLKKIDSKDTAGLYTQIYSAENKNPNTLYFLLSKGDYALTEGNVKDALNNYSEALTSLNGKPQDSLYALVNYKIGAFHFLNNSYPEALKYLNRASLIYNYKAENYHQARLYAFLGNIHIDLTSVDESIRCFRTALAYYRKTGDQKRFAAMQNNIAIAYTNKKDFVNAEKYLDSSLTLRKKLEDLYGVGQTYNNYGAMYFKKGEFQKALDFYKLGYENRITAKLGPTSTVESQINIGKTYFKLNDNKNAIDWLEQALAEAKVIHHFEYQKRAAEELKEVYSKMNNFSKAYEIQELYYRINDSLYGMDKKNMVENLVLQNQFETKIRQDSISNFEKINLDKIVAGEKEKRNSIFFFVLIIGIVFLSVFVFQLYRSNANKKKANAIILEQKDALNQKQIEIIDSITYAKRIQDALLPTSKYIDKNIDRLKEKMK